MEVKFYNLNEVDQTLFTRVVVVCQYNGKWVCCKHKDRDTWEIPGGHIEEGEDWLTAAKRELYEETGATEFEIVEPICAYSISKFALLCFAKIKKLEKLPNFEMREIGFFDKEPQNLTYPEAHSKFFEKVKQAKKIF